VDPTAKMRLKDALNEQTVRAKLQVSSWEQAVEEVGKVMVNATLIAPGYIEAMKSTIRELGPYSVIAPGIAMPHARPEDGVLQTGFSLVTLAQPVEFGSSENDPVDIVIAFSALDKETHLDALKEISTLLSDSRFVEKVRSAENHQQLIDIIGAFEAES
jgi:mannitol/fructose-specific phosphotransferase system IIA component (Ntr-type)